MQALESLNDNQVNDFLSGKSPLNLSVRLGDHMMLIQLQLSTLSPSQQNSLKQKVANAAALKQAAAASRSIINCGNSSTTTTSLIPDQQQQLQLQQLQQQQLQPSTSGHSQKRSIEDAEESAPEKQQKLRTMDDVKAPRRHDEDDDASKQQQQQQSPIKSLSSMVSASPMSTASVQSMNHNKFFDSIYKPASPSTANMDPISANLTSCLCKRLNISCNNNCEQRPSTSSSVADDEPCCSYSSSSSSSGIRSIQSATPSTSSAAATSADPSPPRLIPFHNRPASVIIKPKHKITQTQTTTTTVIKRSSSSESNAASAAEQTLLNTDNPALAEASRNLTQTLRKLSKRVFTSKNHLMEDGGSGSSNSRRTSQQNSVSPSTASSSSSGAVIESMKHHGKGIYSGTFSGTLNPALQDKNGRPKRDISTIIHILNDLLSATPQCAKSGAKIFFEPTQSTSGASATPNGKFIKVCVDHIEFLLSF